MLRFLKPTALLFIVVLYLSACGGGDQGEYADDQLYSSDNYQDESFSDDISDYEEDMAGWRRGKMRIQFEIEQGAQKSETNDGQTTDIEWLYALKLSATQNVWVLNDLSKNTSIDAQASAEERLDAFDYQPYMELDRGGDMEVKGQIDYNTKFVNDSPNDISVIHMEKTSNGSAVLDYVKISDFKPSKYGQGYQFDITLQPEITFKDRILATARDGTVQEISDDGINPDEMKFNFFPTPDSQVLTLYPYEFAYSDAPQVTEQFQGLDQDRLRILKEISAGKADILFQEFVGASTVASKDKLIVSYQYQGDKLIPFTANLSSMAAKDTDGRMNITVTLTPE